MLTHPALRPCGARLKEKDNMNTEERLEEFNGIIFFLAQDLEIAESLIEGSEEVIDLIGLFQDGEIDYTQLIETSEELLK